MYTSRATEEKEIEIEINHLTEGAFRPRTKSFCGDDDVTRMNMMSMRMMSMGIMMMLMMMMMARPQAQ